MTPPRIYQASARHLLCPEDPTAPQATLASIDGEWLARIASLGFDWLYLYGVWETGDMGRRVSLAHPSFWRESLARLPGGGPADVVGSPFAIKSLKVDERLGGDTELDHLRERCHRAGLSLMLDFVVNHTALDHPWVAHRPDWYIQPTKDSADTHPGWFFPATTLEGPRILAHGRDPYFPSWLDTAQLNLLHPGLIEAQTDAMLCAASRCDGLRCDMAMLALTDIFRATWGELADPADGRAPASAGFWESALPRVKARHPETILCAEAYWDTETRLLDLGFDLAYDKPMLDIMRHGDGRAIREHLARTAPHRQQLVRFAENHDEKRMAVEFVDGRHAAGMTLTWLGAGPVLIHDGQETGRRFQAGIHLARRAPEPPDTAITDLVARLVQFRREFPGRVSQAITTQPAWMDNASHEQLVAWGVESDCRRGLVCINYAPHPSQGRLVPPADWINIHGWNVLDQASQRNFSIPAAELSGQGLFVDLPPWGFHLFVWDR